MQHVPIRNSFLGRVVIIVGILLSGVSTAQPAVAENPSTDQSMLPTWLYPTDTPPSAPPPTPDAVAQLKVPGSPISRTMAQVLDRFGPPDWHPDGHPSMPVMVAAGQKPDIWACAFCHLPNGQGRPENAALAGLSSSYFLQSMHDYKTGARASSNPVVTAKMTEFAKAMTDEQIRQAADYFERLKYRSWVKVQESATAPAYRVSARMLVPLPGTREPLGQRIVEVPAAPDRVELRDDTSGFIAYVPVGSVKKGAALAKSIDPMACAGCHGAGLKGSAAAPPLAGRSPSQMLRQLYDFHTGARQGTNNVAMTAIVASLSLDEMISIAAYTASLAP